MREEKKNDKITAIYKAVQELLETGVDVRTMRVADVAVKAGIGKGTTYEYFSSKEEMIVKSMAYASHNMVVRIIAQMEKVSSFQDKFMILLNEMEEKIKQRVCLLKFLNMISENGIYQELYNELLNDAEVRKSHPMRLITYLVERGLEEGIFSQKYPKENIEISIFSRMIAFLMYVDAGYVEYKCSINEIKENMYNGICREFCD